MSIGVDYASIDQNSPPDFTRAKAKGISFAYVRAAVGVHPDPTFARDRDRARAAGVSIGPFLAIDWSASPVDLAQVMKDSVGELRSGELPPAIDVEFSQGIAATGLRPMTAVEKIEQLISALRGYFPTVVCYTSRRVWTEDLADIPSAICAACPLWLKVPYPWNPRNPPHLESIPQIQTNLIPLPWLRASAGTWIEQFQGDAIGVSGFTSTVDLDSFLNAAPPSYADRAPWIAAKLDEHQIAAQVDLADRVRQFQTQRGLVADGIVGVLTWAQLCHA